MRVKPLVLVLDDDELFRAMMEKVVSKLGFTVKVTATVEEFLSADTTYKPDIYMIDLHVGEHSGLDLVEELRGDGNNKPIFVISGEKEPSVVSHALELGANDYILKPFNRSLLAAKLGHLVRTEEIQDQEKLIGMDDHVTHEAKLRFDLEVAGVDELGFHLLSQHLIPKGTTFRLGGEIVQNVTGKKDCLVSVSSTALRSGGKGYEIYAELAGADAALLAAVRLWLTKVLIPQAA